MDVVKSNYLEIFPQVEEIIRESAFIAIDTEFTGLSTSLEDERSLFDSVDEFYAKIRRLAHNFVICQIGLSCFVKNKDQNKYVAHSYNFYLFPKDEGDNYNPRFLLQTSNMEFLCQHKFDFNKWIYEGLPYCNQDEASLVISECNDQRDRIEVVGFHHIFQLLIQHKKPLLGHNMLLDMVYMIRAFHSLLPEKFEDFKRLVHSLFPCIIDTKNISLALRKKLDDDKSRLLENTSLGDLYNTLNSSEGTRGILCFPDVAHDRSSIKYSSGEAHFHEAGFDAYCVGFIFLRLAHMLSMNGVKSTEARPVHFRQYLRITEPYTNRINVSRGPMNFIDFTSSSQHVKEKHILLVRDNNNDIVSLKTLKRRLSEYGSCDVRSLSDGKALVAVSSGKRLSNLMDVMSHDPTYTVEIYGGNNSLLLSAVRRCKQLILPLTGSFLIIFSLYYMFGYK